MQTSSITHIRVKKISSGALHEADDELAVEEPLEIQLAWGGEGMAPLRQTISVTMRTPGHDEALAAGFLFTEGIIKHIDEIQNIQTAGNSVQVTLTAGIVPQLKQAERSSYTNAACGVCGKTNIDAIRITPTLPPSADDMVIPAGLFYGLQHALHKKQVLFETTGGIHASALFDTSGHCLQLYEDVGRHNALDKLIGSALLNRALPLQNHILLLSGRAGFELVQKAVMARVPVIAAVGAPSSLAVELATEYNITLIGFLRNNRFNVYTGWQRIVCNYH